MFSKNWRWKSKSYLHHILPPFSILVVVVSVVQVDICLLQVDAAARAASLSDLAAVGAAHVDETKDGEGDWNRDQDVVDDRSKVEAGFFFGGSRFFFGGSRFFIGGSRFFVSGSRFCIKRLELVQSMGMNQQ